MTSNTSTRPFAANITRFSHLNQSDTANTAITKLIVDPTYRHQKRLEYMSPQTRGWPVVLHRNTNSQGQTWGVNCGSLPGVLLGAQTLGLCAGGEIVSGLPLFERNGIESTVRIMATHYLPPPCHVQIYSFFSRLHLKHKMHVAWRG